jgi:hypothetical protein
LWAAPVAILAYIISGIPYYYCYSSVPDGFVNGRFLGGAADINMYFSFIRQVVDGHYLLINRLTHIDHSPVFFNLEWLLIGKIMAIFNLSELMTFEIWRAIGAYSVAVGFIALANKTIQTTFQLAIATLMCLFGGGFGWIFLGLSNLGIIPFDNSTLLYFDLFAGRHPFIQILFNPHFSLPLGILLIFFTFFVYGEQTNKTTWYILAGATGLIEGAMRPYDIIALYAIIPFFIVIEFLLSKEKQTYYHNFQRIIPLLLISPLLLYFTYLFSFHPVFKYWGSQGTTYYNLSFLQQCLTFGLTGVLCLIRFALIKKFPLQKQDRILLAWVTSVIFLENAYKLIPFIPYSSQLLTITIPPAILLGIAVLQPSEENFHNTISKKYIAALALFILINSGSSISSINHTYMLVKYGENRSFDYYLPEPIMNAFNWLKKNSKPKDIVLSRESIANELAKFVSIRVVVGHWSVTPEIEKLRQQLLTFFSGGMPPFDAEKLLSSFHTNWILHVPTDSALPPASLDLLPSLKKCFEDRGVMIYARNSECNASN